MIVFLDFEASSLNSGSFPVEIGWCSHDLSRGWSSLIRPCRGWTDWSRLSEAIHGVSLAQLTAKGSPADETMARLNADLAGIGCISDNPEHDLKWLWVLGRGCGVEPTFGIDATPLDALVAAACRKCRGNCSAIDSIAASMAREAGVMPHRALDDCVVHSLRLGAVAVMAEEDEETAMALRAGLVERSRGLLEREGRR